MRVVFFFTCILFLCGVSAYGGSPALSKQQQAAQWLQQQPVSFLENKGQLKDSKNNSVPFVLFKASFTNMDVYITEQGLTYVFTKLLGQKQEEPGLGALSPLVADRRTEMAWIKMNLAGASIKKENIVKETRSKEHFNFFYGHCPNGIYNVHKYEKITVKDIYPGIDWVIYTTGKAGVKYDFVVHAGANPAQIKMLYESAVAANLDKTGNIRIKSMLGTLTEHAPYSYLAESKLEVSSRFMKKQLANNKVEISFHLSEFPHSSDLIIDPDLTWGTFYGGSTSYEGALSIDTDTSGNVYVTGHTSSTDFPTQAGTGAFTGSYLDTTGSNNAFILRFNSSGVLEWATYYGGSFSDNASFITTDRSGNIYVTGLSASPDFPTQAGTGAFTGAYYDNTFGVSGADAFILRFNSNGIREWATFYGGNGSGYDYGIALATDTAGNLFVTGAARTADFPTQPGTGAYTGAYRDSTFGGPGGYDVFILRFSNTGRLEWSTLYGGATGSEAGAAIVTDLAGNVYVAGATQASVLSDFPVQAGTGPFTGAYYDSTYNGGLFDIFLLRFNTSGVLEWATFYGGSSVEDARSLVTDKAGNLYLTGFLSSSNFPVQAGTGPFAGAYYDGTYNGGTYDAFIARFNTTGALQWSTFLGGSGDERMTSMDNLAIDNAGTIYTSFLTSSTDLARLRDSCGNYYSPNLKGFTDQFIYQFTNTGRLKQGTYIGGEGGEERSPLATDKWNNLYVGGEYVDVAFLPSYPLRNPGGGAYFDSTYNGEQDIFLVRLSPCGQPISLTAGFDNVSCFGQCDGQATASPAGGTAPYTYNWNNGQTTQTVTGLCAGAFAVTITDALSATVQSTVTISQPAPLTLLTTPGTSICPGDSAILTASASNGSGGYTYNWTPVTGLNIGTGASVIASPAISTAYIVTATDTNGCTGTDTVALDVYPVAAAVISSSDSLICSSDSARITATTGYTFYQWNTGDTGTFIKVNSAGNYWLTATDANGCKSISNRQSIEVYPPTAVSIIIQGSLLSTTNAAAYQWLRNGQLIPGATLDTLVADISGDYAVQITDSNGCIAVSNSVYISITGLENQLPGNGIFLYPNPTTGEVFLTVQNGINVNEVRILNMLGQQVYGTPLLLHPSAPYKLELSLLPSGIYHLLLFSEGKPAGSKSLVID